MAILIKFTNPNVEAVTINVYRGDTELDRSNLGTPLATLTGNPTEYLDPTAVQGNTYYYVFEVLGTNDRDISQNIKIVATETRGAGPNVLKFGTRDLGFYGAIKAPEFMTAAQLIDYCNVDVTNATEFPTWLKYAYKGKVYLIPSHAIGGASFDQLGAHGLIAGKEINHNGFKYLIRLPWGVGADQAEADGYLAGAEFDVDIDMDTVALQSEFNDLYYPAMLLTPVKQRYPNYLNATVQEATRNAGQVMVRDIYDGNVVRRTRPTDDTRLGLTTMTYYEGSGGVHAWWPMLELVEV